MLSIRHMASGRENYYLQLAREDYFLEGGEPPGRWCGSALASLGLDEGTVEKDTLRTLMDGFAPDGRPLVQNAGKPNRQPGWDLTFSAPKAVSALWSQADPEARAILQEAQDSAAREALAYLERHAAWTRKGRGGRGLEAVGLVAALFEHGTSRAQQPQLHTHCLVLNMGATSSGEFGAVRSEDFYHHKMAAGAVYRATLAHGLRTRLALDPKPVKDWFNLRGVPRWLSEHFSARRAEIEQAIATSGLRGAKAFADAALATRSHKEHVPRETLFSAWRAFGASRGFGPKEAAKLTRPGVHGRGIMDRTAVEALVFTTIRDMDEHLSFFTVKDIVRRAALQVQDGRAPVALLIECIERHTDQLVDLGRVNGYSYFTSRKNLAAERALLDLASEGRDDPHPLRGRGQDSVGSTAAASGLTDEQAQALRHITEEPGWLKLVSGLAGTGKSRLLQSAREVWERSGYTVLGAAVAGKAARGLQDASGIESETIAKTLMGLADGQTKLTPRTVLVIDEAAMLGTRQLGELMTRARAGGAKVVLVGDERQLPPIEAGAPFAGLVRRLGAARLTDVQRQQHEDHRLATASLAEGDIETALSLYQRLGRLHLFPTRRDALGELVGLWNTHRTRDLASSLMIAATNEQVDRLNELAQRVRRSRHEVHGPGVAIDGAMASVGDRVRFTRNSRKLGVWNGDTGTVTAARRHVLGGGELTIRLDRTERRGILGPSRRREVTVDTRAYNSLRLGYALTTHAAQGVTVDRSFVLADPATTSSELAYVQLTRHREDVHIAASADSVGEDLQAIAEAMSRTRDLRMAIDVITSPVLRDPEQEVSR